MDRLETIFKTTSKRCIYLFTFQYGQIRNLMIKGDILHSKLDLHSSMDRLETLPKNINSSFSFKFTFQYGQIRNFDADWNAAINIAIYIPVWIDQKRTLYI